jgi:hypothetical protein
VDRRVLVQALQITALRYGIPCTTSSETACALLTHVVLISTWSRSWTAGLFTSSAMIHSGPVEVVSMPAVRNSKQSVMILSSMSAQIML